MKPIPQWLDDQLARCQWVLVHSRMTDTLYFGPFPSREAAWEWAQERGVNPSVIPLVPTDVSREHQWMGWQP